MSLPWLVNESWLLARRPQLLLTLSVHWLPEYLGNRHLTLMVSHATNGAGHILRSANTFLFFAAVFELCNIDIMQTLPFYPFLNVHL